MTLSWFNYIHHVDVILHAADLCSGVELYGPKYQIVEIDKVSRLENLALECINESSANTRNGIWADINGFE